MPGKTDQDKVAVGEPTKKPAMLQHNPIVLKRRSRNPVQVDQKLKDFDVVVAERHRLHRAGLVAKPKGLDDDQLTGWWHLWFIGDSTRRRSNEGRVWYALDDHPESIEDFLAFGSFLEVDDNMAFGAWPEVQHQEAAVVRLLDEMSLSLFAPGSSAGGIHNDLDKMPLLTVAGHARNTESPLCAEANAYLKRLRVIVRKLPIEKIRHAHNRFEEFLAGRKTAMEWLRHGPYQMPPDGRPVSSFKLFARRHAMGLITTEFFDGIPFGSFLRLPAKERREVMKCFDAKEGRKRDYQRKAKSAPPRYYKRLMAWLVDNWPVFVEHRWDWKNVFDASQEAGFTHHYFPTDLIKWFSEAHLPHKLNPNHKVGQSKQEALLASQKHLLTPAPPALPAAD